jgi:hypothetical protein
MSTFGVRAIGAVLLMLSVGVRIAALAPVVQPDISVSEFS